MSRLLALALLPAGILLGYIYRMDTIEKEPTKLLIRLFLFGCLCAVPASILEGIGTTLLDGVDSTLIKLLAGAIPPSTTGSTPSSMPCASRWALQPWRTYCTSFNTAWALP